jgi:hypothetical protein
MGVYHKLENSPGNLGDFETNQKPTVHLPVDNEHLLEMLVNLLQNHIYIG